MLLNKFRLERQCPKSALHKTRSKCMNYRKSSYSQTGSMPAVKRILFIVVSDVLRIHDESDKKSFQAECIL